MQIRKEIKCITKLSFLSGVNHALNFVGTRFMLFVCFVVYVFMGGKLDAETVFVTMALFDTLGISVVKLVPATVTCLAECLVTTSRAKKVLLLEEKEISRAGGHLSKGSIAMNDYSAKWNKVCRNCD